MNKFKKKSDLGNRVKEQLSLFWINNDDKYIFVIPCDLDTDMFHSVLNELEVACGCEDILYYDDNGKITHQSTGISPNVTNIKSKYHLMMSLSDFEKEFQVRKMRGLPSFTLRSFLNA